MKKVVAGGATRQESSTISVECCGYDTRYVLIHDAVRPFITNNLLDRLLKALDQHDAAVPVISSADTIVETDRKGFISKIPNRSMLWRVRTPRAFKYELIKEAHKQALDDGIKNSTDDCSLVSRLGYPVSTVKGNEKNIKITFPDDFKIADAILKKKQELT